MMFTVIVLVMISSLYSYGVYCDVFIILNGHCDMFTLNVVFDAVMVTVLDCVYRNDSSYSFTFMVFIVIVLNLMFIFI